MRRKKSEDENLKTGIESDLTDERREGSPKAEAGRRRRKTWRRSGLNWIPRSIWSWISYHSSAVNVPLYIGN